MQVRRGEMESVLVSTELLFSNICYIISNDVDCDLNDETLEASQ